MRSRGYAVSWLPMFFALALVFALSGCSKPTYPKDKLEGAVESIIKKECKIDSKAKLVGKTFYLTVALPDLLATQADIQKVVLKKLQNVNLAVIRVSLSTDAKLDYLVMIVDLPGWDTSFTIAQRLEDLKGYLYQRISKGDYEERVIYEMRNREAEHKLAFNDLTKDEFIARLIVSKYNWIKITNPFINAALGLRLELEDFTKNAMVFKLAGNDEANPLSTAFVEKTLVEWANKIVRKYKAYNFNHITVIDAKGKQISEIKLKPVP